MTDLERTARRVVETFSARGATLGTAESLTGGMIAAAVADVSGASKVLMGGVVSYDPKVKRDVLGVSQVIIDGVGVVSEACAIQMAKGARKILGTDIAVSATGIAGPTGGTEENPVGTVWLGVSGHKGTFAKKCHFEGDRMAVREQSAQVVLDMALEILLEESR